MAACEICGIAAVLRLLEVPLQVVRSGIYCLTQGKNTVVFWYESEGARGTSSHFTQVDLTLDNRSGGAAESGGEDGSGQRQTGAIKFNNVESHAV